MIYAITPERMRQLEEAYVSLMLMEKAAQAVADQLPKDGRILFLCGFGRNGGDGYAAARLFNGHASVWQLEPNKLNGDAKTNAARLKAECPQIEMLEIKEKLPPIPKDTICIVDALFGTGLSRPIEGMALKLIKAANESGLRVISCDIPSGIHARTGEIMGCAIRATTTATFHQPKIGLYLKDAVDFCGNIVIADIGIKEKAMDGASIILPSDLPLFRKPRLKNTHKGDYGRVLIIAGKTGMAGAAAICAKAAIAAGAGLTTIACDENIMPILQTLVPCAMCVPMAEIASAIEKADVIAIGPGLGASDERLPIVRAVLNASKPTVWDADALNILAKHSGLRPQSENNIFTPHPGEAARLGKMPVGTTVLKGATSIITSGTKTALNIIGTPAMAKGGSGDALTGIIAALYAQNSQNPFLAAQLGCLLHGMAGCAAAEKTGENAMDAFHLIAHIS